LKKNQRNYDDLGEGLVGIFRYVRQKIGISSVAGLRMWLLQKNHVSFQAQAVIT
jgi:hypothetical protein